LILFPLPAICQSADGARIYKQSSSSVFLIYVASEDGTPIALGSGFLIARNTIVTNAHVVERGNISVELGPARVPAKVSKLDHNNDLALLTIDAQLATKPLALSAENAAPGDPVYAMGNPEGLERSISHGIVAAVRDFEGKSLLQITTPISHGSSGGPVFNSKGEVIGITVGMLKEGQNLNFAIPVSVLRQVLAGQGPRADLTSMLQQIDQLKSERDQETYSTEPNSPYQQKDLKIDELLKEASSIAWDDASHLMDVAKAAQYQNNEIMKQDANRALVIKNVPEAHLLLAKALTLEGIYQKDPDKTRLLKEAETHARSVIANPKERTADAYYTLADVLEDEDSETESKANFAQALSLARQSHDSITETASLRGLIRTTSALKQYSESQNWFNELVRTGNVNAVDWISQADRLSSQSRFAEAGQAYETAAGAGGYYVNWCQASVMYSIAENDDSVLSTARACIEKGTGVKDSEQRLSAAHRDIADVLNKRGVYSDALIHAKEATALNESDAFSFYSLANALLGLHRPQEAAQAAQQAIRLSDGKWATMHFALGSAYFDMENWSLAAQSFQKAAELDPKEPASAYNVGLCMAKQGYYVDAAKWYEEVLRRDPNRSDKTELLRRIEILRR
jgi:tetratricopeptide (TPR) repeat protein